MTEAYKNIWGPKSVKSGDRIGGAFQSFDVGHGEVATEVWLNGGFRPSTTRYAPSGYDLAAHELSHAVDGPDYALSNSKEWKAAHSQEMSKGQLTAYAGTNPQEGWAEFGRLLITSSKADRASLKSEFPKSYEVWRKRGLTYGDV
jgi:hypothetical protein